MNNNEPSWTCVKRLDSHYVQEEICSLNLQTKPKKPMPLVCGEDSLKHIHRVCQFCDHWVLHPAKILEKNVNNKTRKMFHMCCKKRKITFLNYSENNK